MLNLIRRERIYILMLFFILALNVIGAVQAEKPGLLEKRALSEMSFKDMGLTEEKVEEFLESGKPAARFFKYAIMLGFFIFIIGIVLNLSFIIRGKRIDFKTLPYKTSVPWGIPDLIRVSIVIIFAAYLIGILESFIFKIFRFDTGLNLRMVLNTFFIDIAVGAIILYFVIVKYKEGIEKLGLRSLSFLRSILSGVTAYISILPFLLVILVFSLWFLNLLGYSPPPQPVFEIFMEEKRSRVLFFLTIFVSMFGPIIEEIFFRGFMYNAIKKYTGVIPAAFLSASVFSLLHANIVGFLPIMALGVLLAYLYESTGSLVASMTVHILHNSIIVGFVFFLKGLIG